MAALVVNLWTGLGWQAPKGFRFGGQTAMRRRPTIRVTAPAGPRAPSGTAGRNIRRRKPRLRRSQNVTGWSSKNVPPTLS